MDANYYSKMQSYGFFPYIAKRQTIFYNSKYVLSL